jgi:hypothetical protein
MGEKILTPAQVAALDDTPILLRDVITSVAYVPLFITCLKERSVPYVAPVGDIGLGHGGVFFYGLPMLGLLTTVGRQNKYLAAPNGPHNLDALGSRALQLMASGPISGGTGRVLFQYWYVEMLVLRAFT